MAFWAYGGRLQSAWLLAATRPYMCELLRERQELLPVWLQPHQQPTAGEHRGDNAGISSPPCENCVFIVDPAREQGNCLNASLNTGAYTGFRLHLSGSEDTPAGSTPTGREMQKERCKFETNDQSNGCKKKC